MSKSVFVRFALLRRRNFRHLPLLRQLPWLWLVEGAKHDKHSTTVLHGSHSTVDVRVSVSNAINLVDNWCKWCACKEITLHPHYQHWLPTDFWENSYMQGLLSNKRGQSLNARRAFLHTWSAKDDETQLVAETNAWLITCLIIQHEPQ